MLPTPEPAPGPPFLVVATRNPGKLVEVRALLAGLSVRIRDGRDLPEVEETGRTFAENARLKATAAVGHTGCWVLADDSGLEVDALDCAPGVRSARFGNPGIASDAGRNELLLERLRGVPWERRRARFRCAAALASPEGRVWLEEGVCEGIICLEPRGSAGFGYDPLFYVPEYDRTLAELPPAIKNRISHRALALLALRPALEAAFGAGATAAPEPLHEGA